MERTKYINDTRPTQIQLDHTEGSRVRSILRRQRATCQLGVARGFLVTVNATNSLLIDIGPGEGYTGGLYEQIDVEGENSGERVSTLSETASGGVVEGDNIVVGQALANYTNGTKNYVSIVYAETEGSPLAEIYYPFTQHNTVVRESYSVSVLTETQWNALSVNDLRNRILVGIVTANGAGVALTAANIQQVTQPKSHPTATAPLNVTGVTILGLSDETLIGTGTLRYSASDRKLHWTAPGDTEGIGVAMSSSGTYTLQSATTTYYLTVEAIYDALPSTDQSDSITIQSLYGDIIPRYSATDTVHRDKVGTGQISDRNPHGTSLDDIEEGTFAHADLYHLNGISGDADSTQLLCSVNAVTDSIEVVNNGGFRNSFLIDGVTYETLAGVATGTIGSVPFDVTPAPDSGDYLIYVDSAGDLQKVLIASYTPADAADLDVLWGGNIEILDMHNKTSGNGTIDYDSSAGTLTWQAPGDGGPGAVVTLMGTGALYIHFGIYKLYSVDTDNWIIVQLSGVLGGDNASTFTVDKNETDHADESILKLTIVTWNATGEILGNLRDARSFRTADTKQELYEEHDEDGRHSKPLQQRLDVYAAAWAVRARAVQSAVVGSADSAVGVVGVAVTDSGVYGLAERSVGVGGSANTIGVRGIAANVTGVYGSAPNTGGYFVAAADYGVYAEAGDATAVFATAVSIGVYARVDDETAIYARALGETAVYGTAGNSAGVFAASSDFALWVVGLGGGAVNGLNPQSAIGVRGAVAGAGATGVAGFAAAGVAGAFSGATALYADGLINYDVAIVGAGAGGNYIPILIAGVQYKIHLYADA